MERFDSFPLPLKETDSEHLGVCRPIKGDVSVSAKIVAIGIFLPDDSAYEESLPHTFATLSISPANPDAYRHYRGGCYIQPLNALLEIELRLLENGTIIGRAQLVDIDGHIVPIAMVQVVLNFMISKNEK